MDLIDRVNTLAAKIRKTRDSLETEEATKNALIMPFISQVLGYDVFDPAEVIPEFTADTGVKKGEKVDYAIMNSGELTILIEAKKAGEPLNKKHGHQLFRYFSVTRARIAILTNGIEYQFYTDLDEPNKMDEKPFMVLNLTDFDESMLGELKKLSKDSFDIENVVNSAGELKYTREIKVLISELSTDPSEEFIRMLAKQVYSGGAVTIKVMDIFTDITKRAFKQFINESISDRLKSALGEGNNIAPRESQNTGDEVGVKNKESLIVTTEEELEGYHLVKALVRDFIDPTRVIQRDTQSYFGILIDDNNRKPLCRLRFNAAQKYIGLMDDSNVEVKIAIKSINEIYQYSDRLIERAKKLSS
jgi:hypothetical protein